MRDSIDDASMPRRCLRRSALALALAMTSLARTVAAQVPVEHCINEPDDARRLACYDQVFRRSERPAAPEAAASVPSEQTPPMRRLPTVLDSFWELTPEHKRGTFSVRTYLPNFVLPLHYTADPTPRRRVRPDRPSLDRPTTSLWT